LRAEETRALAEEVVDPQAKGVLLEIAKRCERVARLAELVQAVGATPYLTLPLPSRPRPKLLVVDSSTPLD
jgi:hypothetical protein